MFFVVLALAHLALNEPRRLVVLVCGLVRCRRARDRWP